MLSHSHEKLFCCPFCERQYKRKNDMIRHINKNHKELADINPKCVSMYLVTLSEQLAKLIEENRKQKEMIVFLLERNKQLQESQSSCIMHI